MRGGKWLGAAWLLIGLSGPAAAATELVVLERAGCGWCVRFEQEIAGAYARTTEGQRAPLRRVRIDTPLPADLADLAGERITPSFVLRADGREIGRIRGYPGDAFFYPMLARLLARLPIAEN